MPDGCSKIHQAFLLAFIWLTRAKSQVYQLPLLPMTFPAIKNIFTTTLVLVVFLTASAYPAEAPLAFDFPSIQPTATAAFKAQLQAIATNMAVPPVSLELPVSDHSDLVMVASASPVTEQGKWVEIAPKKTTRVVRNKFVLEAPIVLEGEASYYSRAGCLGCNPLFIMANGQPLNDNALTMAIGADKVHLVGYQAKVTNLATNMSVVVRITDTGGFYKDRYGNRVADLTIGTKTAIGMKGGKAQVRVEVF